MAREMGPGGTERQLTEVAKTFDRNEFETHVAYFIEGVRSEELRQAGVRCVRIPVRSFLKPHAWSAAFQLGAYLRKHRIQIAHAYDFPLIAFGVPVARLAGVPVVLSSQRGHRSLIPNGYRTILRRTDRWVDGIVVNCEAMKHHLVNEEHVDPRQVKLCYNGVDLNHFSPGARPLGLSKETLVIGTVSVQRPEKNIGILLRAFAKIALRHSHLRLVLVGDGSERASLERLARELGLSENCRFVASQDDVVPFLRCIDIFVLPSLVEALSNSLMEAMACGCAVIASRVGGNPELISDGTTGLLFESNNSDDLSHCLETLINNAVLRRQFAGAALRRTQEQFSLAASARRMALIYEELIARKGTRRR